MGCSEAETLASHGRKAAYGRKPTDGRAGAAAGPRYRETGAPETCGGMGRGL